MKSGDTVRLRSGGPRMTVVGCREDGTLDVVWFPSDREARHEAFGPSEVCRARLSLPVKVTVSSWALLAFLLGGLLF